MDSGLWVMGLWALGAGLWLPGGGWDGDSDRVSVVAGDPVVKEQGGRSLAGVGAGGGAGDGLVFRAFRHHIIRGRGGRLLGLRGWLGWNVLRGLGGLRAALLLQLLQFVQGGGEGTLQAGALPANLAQQGELVFGRDVGVIDVELASGDAREQPLGSTHLFKIEALSAGLGLPLGLQAGPQPLVFLGVFVEDNDVAGAEAVFEGVEAHGGLAVRSFRTRGMLRVAPVGFLLLIGDYHRSYTALS